MESNKENSSSANANANAVGSVPNNRLKPVMVAETFVSLAETIVAKKQFWFSLKSTLHVGVLVFDKFRLGEAFRIPEIFGSLKDNVRTSIIAEKRGVIESSSGAVVMVDFSFSDAPELDLLIIPAGELDETAVTTKEYLRSFNELASKTPNILAIGSGALALARTGLLDGLKANINAVKYDCASAQSPRVKWDAESNWVIDDKYFTAAELSGAGDLVNALVCRLFGSQLEQQTVVA